MNMNLLIRRVHVVVFSISRERRGDSTLSDLQVIPAHLPSCNLICGTISEMLIY